MNVFQNKIAVLVIAFTLALSGCASPLQKQHGSTFYTQVSMWAQQGQHESTNYRKGQFIPINTQVTIKSSSGETIRFQVPSMDNYTVTMINVPEYTGGGIEKLFKRTFGPEKVELDKFPDDVREAITNGNIIEGMSKDAVILARGYPPKHETPSLESSRWKYWTSTFGTRVVKFEDGSVVDIVD